MPYAIFTTNRKQWYDGYGVTNRSSRARVFANYDDAVKELDRIDLGTSFAVHEVALCRANGCNRIALAKGYCCTHYGQMWRNGEITAEMIISRKRGKTEPLKRLLEEKGGLEKDLRNAERCYENCYGVDERLKWRKAILENRLRLKTITKRIEERGKNVLHKGLQKTAPCEGAVSESLRADETGAAQTQGAEQAHEENDRQGA